MVHKEGMDNFNSTLLSGHEDTCQNVILPWFECKRSLGRMELTLIATPVGKDLQVIIHGGDAHIGATAVAQPGETTHVITCVGHREDKMAFEIANMLAQNLECTICVSVGIHYANIMYEEIESLNMMAFEIANELLEKIKNFKYNIKSCWLHDEKP